MVWFHDNDGVLNVVLLLTFPDLGHDQPEECSLMLASTDGSKCSFHLVLLLSWDLWRTEFTLQRQYALSCVGEIGRRAEMTFLEWFVALSLGTSVVNTEAPCAARRGWCPFGKAA